VVTNDEALAEKIKILRNYGQKVKNRHDIKSFNSRLDTIQAVVLRIKLAHLDEWNNKRRNNARFYQQYFEATPRIDKKLIKLPNPQTNDHIYHLYVLLAERRDALAEWLKTRGIATGCHYPVPIHLQPCYADLGYKKGDFPIAENYGARTISLPMYPELNEEQIKGVVASVKDFYTKV
jgi:dTDP-4-amino-4,6-dideoxygalactose transaminase